VRLTVLAKDLLPEVRTGNGQHEAATVLKDVLSMTYPDIDHSSYERRYVTIGISDKRRILVVAHADVSGSIRIVSARKATSHERRFYEEG
jgi:uncharacterized DUF497 family protein